MTVKRRKFFEFGGSNYITPWKEIEPGYSEEVYAFSRFQTLLALPDSDYIFFIPEGDKDLVIQAVSRNAINELMHNPLGFILGVENKSKIELAWEPTLPPQSKK